MTTGAVRAGTPRAAPQALAAVTLVAGCGALVARPASPAFTAITLAVGFAGALHPITRERAPDRRARVWLATVALGVAAFALARGALGGSLIPPPTTSLIAASVAVAFAEEAFFRRFAYAWLMRWGVPAAVAVSSFAFAIVHVTFWGWRAFPVDLAAGVLLGWQRWVTASWTAPAVTHATANVLMLL